jgi:VanZ family protein
VALLKYWWPALAWAIVVSLFSTSAFTSDSTGRVIIPILHWLMPRAATATLLEIHHVIRKCGHFAEYFILSLLVLRGIRAGRRDARIGWALAAIAIVACYASLDEFHQSFVPGRTPAIADVLLDTVGAICAQIAFALSRPKRTAPCNQERAESP